MGRRPTPHAFRFASNLTTGRTCFGNIRTTIPKNRLNLARSHFTTGSCGAALPWHGRGQGFESLQVHQNRSNTYGPWPVRLLARGVQTPFFMPGQAIGTVWNPILPTRRASYGSPNLSSRAGE